MANATQERLWRYATLAQSASAATVGSVLIVHLAAPVVAALVPGPGGVDLANQTMLLGREYYQQALLEPIVVWGAMGMHVGASAIRRWLRPTRRTSWHAFAGLALIPVVAWHVCLNRLVPMTSRAPIAHLSPSELDMAHVGAGLQTFPIVTWSFYTWLCVAGAVHMVGGLPKLRRRYARTRSAMQAGLALAGVLLLGTWAIGRYATHGVARSTLDRIVYCYRQVWPYAWLHRA